MTIIEAPRGSFDPDARFHACTEAAERALQSLIAEAETKGWQPAEMAMAIADAAEEFILFLAQKRALKH